VQLESRLLKIILYLACDKLCFHRNDRGQTCSLYFQGAKIVLKMEVVCVSKMMSYPSKLCSQCCEMEQTSECSKVERFREGG
jgi:hypothetical protein